jgi:undecaprenyl-phosphate 4-deoxy-4-formamido-L-arabinose transferase
MNSPLPKGLSIVCPVFNSAATLSRLAARVEAALIGGDCPLELILVNDGSADESWTIIEKLAEDKSWIKGVNLMRNYGQHNALLCGVRLAQYDTTVTLDDDLQNPPEEIPDLVAKLQGRVDVVYGIPLERQHDAWRDFSSAVVRFSLWPLIGRENARIVSSFRAFRTSLREAFRDYSGPFVSLDVLLAWGSRGAASVAVAHHRRAEGRSTYTFFKLAGHAVTMLTGFSTWPLRLASLTGLAFVLLGIGILLFVLVSYLIHGGSLPGFPFLASTVALFSGAQLFALGVIGEYVAKIHFRSMNRPSYVIGSRT